jgi:hypothetical protein
MNKLRTLGAFFLSVLVGFESISGHGKRYPHSELPGFEPPPPKRPGIKSPRDRFFVKGDVTLRRLGVSANGVVTP